MSTVIVTRTDTPATISVDEAKAHLRIVGDDLDEQVQLHLEAAIDYVEEATSRTLRLTEQLTQSYADWPASPVRFVKQPVKTIDSVQYYDADDAQQTVTSTDYRLIASTRGGSCLEFVTTFSGPGLFSRSDAVQITYTAGYAADADGRIQIPERARQAILLKLSYDWGDLPPREAEFIGAALDRQIGALSWGMYR